MPALYQGIRCEVCGEEFDEFEDFKGHTTDGAPCPGGRPI